MSEPSERPRQGRGKKWESSRSPSHMEGVRGQQQAWLEKKESMGVKQELGQRIQKVWEDSKQKVQKVLEASLWPGWRRQEV